MHAVTMSIKDSRTGEVKLTETVFMDLRRLDKIEQDFKLRVFGQVEFVTLQVEFDPPLEIEDEPPPPEAES